MAERTFITPDVIIKKAIQKALSLLNLPIVDIGLEHPADEAHGDYSSNVAMQLFPKRLSLQDTSRLNLEVVKNPRELAQKVVSLLEKDQELKKIVSKIEIAGPGFINFWLSEGFLTTTMIHIIEVGDMFGSSEELKGKSVIIEYTDPNPFKEFHIGHLYSNIAGESLARLFEVQGAMVKRANYQGDVGMHVAKSLWALQKNMTDKKLSLDELEKKPLSNRMEFLGQAYAMGATAYEQDEEAKKQIQQINRGVYEKDRKVHDLYTRGRQWSLDYFETIYKRLGTKFDYYFFESETGRVGKEIIKKHKDFFEESKGAIVFRGDKYGLHTRVFINSFGLPTYEAKDLGLPFLKHDKFPYDISIIVTGNEINEYFAVVLKALEQINPELRKKTRHVSHGMVRLKGRKMSSRTGDVLRGEWLLDEAKKYAGKLGDDKISEVTSETVGVGAVKYSLLKGNIGRDIIFDFNESISLDGNSGPYLQYTYARCQSVISKAAMSMNDLSMFRKIDKLMVEELSLLRTFYKFPEVVSEAGKMFSPNVIANFLFDLAHKYNLFYQKIPILNAETEEQKKFRLSLTAATAQVIKNGLHLLGIKVPEKM